MRSYCKDKNLVLFLFIAVSFGCYISRSEGTWCPVRGAIMQNPLDGVCGNMEIKNHVNKLEQLNNCTVIEGYLLIMLIDGTEKSFEDYSFPMLREITDYLMLFRVNGLKSLRKLFPNLAVIRGQHLFHNYAFVTYEMRDLEELGLINLRVILRGAVRLTKNNKLCYVDTIDWGRIATGVEPTAHVFRNNKEASQCANYCPQSCQTTKYQDVEAKRCWTAKDCQKNLDCPCPKNTSCMDDGACCHHYCLGGCTGPGPDKCFACQGVVVHDGKCQRECPTGTYMFSNRRCLTDKECLNLRNRNDNQGGNKSMLLRPPEKGAVNLCVMSCPNGYTVAKEGNLKDMECVKCRGSCPKECNGTDVSSIQDAERLKGCSKINGRLIIGISGQSRVAEEFEKNLGDIKEVTDAITIQGSNHLLNLHFFKNLEIIGGEQPASTDGNSLIVRDNRNLQELFPEEVMKRLKIKKGKMSFHGNRMLCKYKIDEFVSYLNLSEPPTEKDINSITNGDLATCMTNELKLRVKMIRHDLALLEWDKVQMGDERSLLVYMINYKEIKDKNVNIHQGRDACSDEVWEVKEQRPAHTFHNKPYQLSLLTDLKPFTMYAVYVQAYTLSTASHSAMTNVKTFLTDPYYPSEPRDLTVTVISSTELEVRWKPPKFPNGNVTHYKVAYLRQTIDSEAYEQRNYCMEPLVIPKKKVVDKVEEEKKVTNMSASSNCCACPKSKDELKEEAIKQEIEVHFENYLQNNLHCKRHDKLPDWVKVDGFTLDNLPLEKLLDELDNITFPQLDYEKLLEEKFNDSLMRYKPENYSRNMDESLIGTVEVFGLKAVISNLEPFVEYIIEVQACHNTNTQDRVKTQLCSNRAITSGRTKSDWRLDTINETSISVTTVSNTSGEVIIKWDAPPNPNGIILMYNLFYKRVWSNQRNILFRPECISNAQYQILNGYRLTRLEPGNWTFYLNAVSLAGNSSNTAEHQFFIPNPPGGDDSNYIFIITIIVVIAAVLIIVLVVVWFVAKNKFRREDMTVISQNVNYVPSGEMYIMDGWEVDRDKIKLVRELGQGSFGMVYEGTAIGIGDDPDEEIRVAVKTVNDRASFNDKREFLKEATTMKAFDCYHVVKLLGVVSHGQPALVIMELMALGDLKNYLREHRPDEQERPGVSPPRLLDILQMAGEIADGMAYLAAKKFVHRDLAARNCMVDENKTVKIGDFGMTRDIYETDYYRKGGKGMLPVRWMAPESLRDGVFTTMSDVWSYGVVMWEMVTLAAQPYQGLSNDEVVKFVSNGNIMDTPDNCPEEMAYLMQRCWNRKPKSRPTFMEIIEYLLPNLNSRFDKVSYFFNEGGGPDEGGRGSNLEPPPDDDDDEEDEVADVVDDFSDNTSSVEGALAPPLSDSNGHLYAGDCFQVNFSQGRDQNGVLNNKIEHDSFCQLNELPEKLNGNTCHDFNLNRSFEGEDFVSDGYEDPVGSDSRSFIRGDYHSVPHTLPHSLSIPSSSPRNSDGSECVPGSGVIELQPLITNDKSPSTAPFSLPSPNSDQSKAVAAAKYPGYQRLPMGSDGHNSAPNNSQSSSSHQKPQLPSAYPLTHARMDRPVPFNRPGTSASRPSLPLGAPSTPSSSSPSSPSPLLPATNAAPPSRPSLRLPVLNQPPGGGFRRVPLFNSGSRDKNYSQRGSQPFQQTGDSEIPSGTNHVQAASQPETGDHQPQISHSSASPHEGAVGSTSSDGSKESTKSSENYSLMNGLSNGYVRHRTANC